MSHRVMTTLETLCHTVEVYSIDEAFLYLADYLTAMTDLNGYGLKLKSIVEMYTGIPVCVGMGRPSLPITPLRSTQQPKAFVSYNI